MNIKKHIVFLISVLLLLSSCTRAQKAPIYAKPFSPSPSPTAEQPEIPTVSITETDHSSHGNATVTVMMYIIGSDLESCGGYASRDINEMMQATLSDDVNLLICTGGATQWTNHKISSENTQIHRISNAGLELLVELDSKKSMVEPDTLSSFINYSAKHYPADRYMMILWDHGGGTISGFGYDEFDPYDYMSLSEMQSAFEESEIHFDFVGFDACLMSTIEMAYMLRPYSDYMIASAETEPGCGWYYTDWLTSLSNDTSVDTLSLGRQIVDDYIDCCSESKNNFCSFATLSVVDLSRLDNTYESLCEYLANAEEELCKMNYRAISIARSGAKYYGGGDYDQVDIVDLISRNNIDGADALISSVDHAVRYVGTTDWADNCCGLAMYFPYDYIEYYSIMVKELKSIGMGNEYTSFFDRFINIMAGGRIVSKGMEYPFDYNTDISENDYNEYDWYEPELYEDYAEHYDENIYEIRELIDKGDYYAMQFTDEDWDIIVSAELQVMLDDGEGYIDLGSDNVCVFDDDNDLIVDFDYTWLTIEGVSAPFYYEYEYSKNNDSWFTYGYTPALLNGDTYIEIITCWSNYQPRGAIAGYRIAAEDVAPVGKGWFSFSEGDTIDLLCDYYTYDGNYDGVYMFGDTITVTDAPLQVCYDYVNYDTCLVSVMLTDIYHNNFWTETVELTLVN